MSSTTDRRIQAINRAIVRSAYDEDIDERTYTKEPFEGGYNRQHGRIIFGILFIILLCVLYMKFKNRK
jgi:hypothetical protein